jgi:putative oxidoreductase
MEQLGIAMVRVAVGIVFLAHGAQKLFVIGPAGVAHMFQGAGIPLPQASAAVVTLVEFAGGIALVLGVGARWAAILLAIVMAVAIGKVHLHAGFFGPRGFEFPLTLLIANLAIALAGPGSPALGRVSKRIGRR